MIYAFVDFRISDIEKNSLENMGFTVVTCPKCSHVYDAICGHPDIMLHFIDDYNVIVYKDIDPKFINFLNSIDFNVILSKNPLNLKYPQDIILNGARIGKNFIHNLNFTDPNLLNTYKTRSFNLINVKQGYSKCSIATISDNALITSDKSIYKEALNSNLDVLLLPPGDICLPGLDYGFIGGTCGVYKDKIFFYGDLLEYRYNKEVLVFLNKHNLKYYSLSTGKLIDRGSIFFITRN